MPRERLLIVPQNWLGDIVMSQVLLKKIKCERNDILIDILINSSFKNLVKRMPEVNDAIEFDCEHEKLELFKRFSLARKIKGSYDRSIVLSRSIKSALIPYLAKIPIRTGELGEGRFILINDIKTFSKEERRKTAYRYAAMFSNKNSIKVKSYMTLNEKYFPSLQPDLENIKRLSKKYNLPHDKKIIIFAPGAAFGPSKMWPVNKFKELAEKLYKDFFIIILGSHNEKNISNQIDIKKNMINLCGETSITDALDLIHLSKFCITNDSGLMHLASATNTKSISIYGATSPDFTPPLTNNKEVHYKRIACSPCFSKKCKYNHYNCLTEIQVNDVFKSFK